jgi:hypothetical protein
VINTRCPFDSTGNVGVTECGWQRLRSAVKAAAEKRAQRASRPIAALRRWICRPHLRGRSRAVLRCMQPLMSDCCRAHAADYPACAVCTLSDAVPWRRAMFCCSQSVDTQQVSINVSWQDAERTSYSARRHTLYTMRGQHGPGNDWSRSPMTVSTIPQQ